MAPRWLHRDEGKRASVFSSLTTTIRNHKELRSPELASTSTFSSLSPLNDSTNSVSVDQTVHDSTTRPRTRSLSRKRISFFGRSPVVPEDVEPVPKITSPIIDPGLVQELPKSTFEDDDDDEEPRSRPLSRRRTSKYFSNRSESTPRWPRRDEKPSRPSTATPDVEEEYPHTLKKTSISAPFNFQHITHTQQQQLPCLDAVADSDLSAQYHAVSSKQSPQRDLRGIKANDIEETQYSIRATPSRPVSRQNSRPSSPAGFRVSSPQFATRTIRPDTLQSSHSTSELPQGTHRAVAISRSTSLADLVAECRSPPTSIHPALRDSDDSKVSPEIEQQSVQPTPVTESGRFLDAVPEELESASAPASPFKVLDRRASHSSHFMQILAQQSARDTSLDSAMANSVQEIDNNSSWKDSLPSLWSGDSWEDDVDYLYEMGMEAEPEVYDFDWDQRTNSYSAPDPRDSVMPVQRKTFASDEYPNVSPRTSMANHERNKSSMALNGFLPMIKSEDVWDPTQAFERPRVAPATPDLSNSPHVSASFELPKSLLHRKSQPERTPPFEAMIRRRSAVVSTPSLSAIKASGHGRSRSEGSSPVSSKLQLNSRWTYVPPSRLSEAVVSPTSGIVRSSNTSRPVSYGASIHPPPTAPLPPIPQTAQRTSVPVNFSHKRASLALSTSSRSESTMRRPRTVEDRSSLQAAARTIPRSSPVTPPLRPSRSSTFDHPSLRNLMERSASNINLSDDVFTGPQTFPAWI